MTRRLVPDPATEGLPPSSSSPVRPLDPTLVFTRPGSPQFPERNARGVFWIQSMPEENGRMALVHLQADGATRTLTDPAYNIRSRVHEYGGRCHVLTDDHCLFVDFENQRLYRQSLAGGPVEIMTQHEPETPAGAAVKHPLDEWMPVDLCLHPSGRWLLAVGERTRDGRENENAIVILDLDLEVSRRRWQTLAVGHDFYASPRFSPDGRHLCLLCWDHPHMPWGNASLEQGAFDAGTGLLTGLERIAGGNDSAACQPGYCKDGTLVFALDGDGEAPWQGFWNLHRQHHGEVETITREPAEYGAAHWVFGHTRVLPIDRHRILAVRTEEAGDSLVLVDTVSTQELDAGSEFVEFSQLSAVYDSRVLLVAASELRAPSVIAVNVNTGSVEIVRAGEAMMPAAHVSKARAVRIPTRDGAVTHAWHYPPSAVAALAPSVSAPGQPPPASGQPPPASGQPPPASGQPPPASGQPPMLMVLVHGGPTSRAGCAFDPLRQFWTTRGFAVLDVNHRGSTGYGRPYRQALDGYWGLRDVDDVIDAVRALVVAGAADPDCVFIRGGSAGGYAVLAALTRYPDTFTAGACYYGIGNLVTLARSTHKFEARYLDSLLGQPWDETLEGDETSVYYRRSPIHAIERVKSPMILFQGSDDKVVPPAVSHEVVAALESAGVQHRYVEYEGEGHGFRSAPNRIDALQSEAAFYAEVRSTT